MAECGGILKVVKPVKSFVFGSITEYVGYIRSYEDNLDVLHRNLSYVCNRKDDILKKVEEGEDRLETITVRASCWLKDVQRLSQHEKLKVLMYKDLKTAKLVVRMMEKQDLKRSLIEEREMQKVVVRVMKMLEEEMGNSGEETMREKAKVDYKVVAEIVLEMMMEATEEFKNCVKKDMKMAIMLTNMLNNKDLDKLTRGDKEMEEIIWEALNISDEELWLENEDVENNLVKAAAEKWLTPVLNLVTPLRKWINDANFNNLVPVAEVVELGLDFIDALLIKTGGLRHEMDDNIEEHKGCSYRNWYKMSKAAEKIVKLIREDIMISYPGSAGILCTRTTDCDLIPSQFLEGLESRTELLHVILERLEDDQVKAIGIFGMGGIGKTTLAKEVIRRAQFNVKVMLEVSDTPNILHIQAKIAELIGMRLYGVENVAQRAIKIYNRVNTLYSKGDKMLVILDNIWNNINLDEIGIPRTCKFLLTTREKGVCRVMDVRYINIFEVNVLKTNEGRILLKSQTRDQVDSAAYVNVVERLLSKCGGLPHAIVATADSLKNKDLASWEDFADYLEKPISNQVSCDYYDTYSILNMSYKFITVVEKRLFFLLACLFPLGSNVSIESLARYGIGLTLFPLVDKLSEAMEVADNWVDELISSSMLLKGNAKGVVKLHNFARAFAILLAAKGERHKFMVDDIPIGLNNTTFNDYTAISLMSRIDYSRLGVVKVDKLQILKLRGELFPSFTDSFFEGMTNLAVLDLSNMSFRHRLPESMGKLKKLRTLCMEKCKLGDIRQICGLVSLLVLSLRESYVEELPDDIGKLCKLRLLDLRLCNSNKVPLISAEVLGRLTNLQEGLYETDSKQAVLETISEKEGTGDNEDNSSPYLDEFKMNVTRIEELPIEDLFYQNLDQFRVSVGKYESRDDNTQFCRVLDLQDIDLLGGLKGKSCVGALLKKAEWLGIRRCRNFEHLVPHLGGDGFRDLITLSVDTSDDVKCIVKGSEMNGLASFHRLQSLDLSYLKSLKMVCDEKVPLGTFSNLQTLELSNLDELEYVLPLALLPHKLNHIEVDSCKLLNFIFIDNGGTHAIELSLLKSLKLSDLPNLLGFVESHKFSNTSTPKTLQGIQFFLDQKITFPSLEILHLNNCNNVVNLWRNGIYASGFQNLKDLQIIDCDKLLSIGPPSLFSSLVQLESLSIRWCERMCEVITPEDLEETTYLEGGEQIIRFHQLKSLQLSALRNLKRFYGGGSRLEFPKLKVVELIDLYCMDRFAKLENSSALFHERVEIPCLEELHIKNVNDGVIGLRDLQSLSGEQGILKSNSTSMLRLLRLDSTSRFRRIPSEIWQNIASLTIDERQNDKSLFPLRQLFNEKDCNWQLLKLEELTVEYCYSLTELFDEKDYYGADDAVTLFCRHLKKLKLIRLLELNRIPMHLFKDLVSLTLSFLNWEYVISADAVGESLQQLEYLTIRSCRQMKTLVIGVLSVIEFRQLKTLELIYLDSLINISSTPEGTTLCLPSLESLHISDCPKLEHFWSGLIVAPRLQDVRLHQCDKMQHFLVGIPENMLEVTSFEWPLHIVDLHLPSLEIVNISRCPDIRSFSHRRLLQSKLTKFQYDYKDYSMQEIGDLNDFLMEKYRSSATRIKDMSMESERNNSWLDDSPTISRLVDEPKVLSLTPSFDPSPFEPDKNLKDEGIKFTPSPFQPDEIFKDEGMKSSPEPFQPDNNLVDEIIKG